MTLAAKPQRMTKGGSKLGVLLGVTVGLTIAGERARVSVCVCMGRLPLL